MKKYILTISLLIASGLSIASNVLTINGEYIDQIETKNVVFNIVYKKFIKGYEKDFLALKDSIEKNNQTKDNSIKFIYVKVDEKFKNFYFQGNGKLEDAANASLSQYEYDLKRVAKQKFDFQEKEVDLFLNNQIKNYRDLLKETLYDYDIDKEEKVFISDISKKIALIIKAEIDANKDYSKKKITKLSKNLYSYDYINKEYISDLKNINNKIDSAIFEEVWQNARSNYKYPSEED